MRRLEELSVNISNRTIVRTILWIFAAVAAYQFIGKITHVLTLLFVSFFLALAMNPVVASMQARFKLKSRIKAAIAAYVIVLAIIASFLVVVTPPLVTQTRDFIRDVPDIFENFQRQDNSLSRAVYRYDLNERLSSAAHDFANEYSNFGGALVDTGKRIVGTVVSILAVLVLTFMMLVEGPSWINRFWSVMSPKNRAHRKELADKMYRSVSGYVNGQIVMAGLAGIFAFTALMITGNIFNVSINAAALAGIVAVLGLIPLFGNPISSTIVIFVCLINSPAMALTMLIYFLVYYQIENMTFQPYIQSRLNKLTPLTVFVAALIGISFSGLLGAIVAIPLASAVKILAEDYFAHHRAGFHK